MPLQKFIFEHGKLEPAENSNELLSFSSMLKQESARQILKQFGLSLPDRLELIAHTNPDDPPDISVLNFGFEVTVFPPDQLALKAFIYQQTKQEIIPIPAIQRTGGSYKKIRDEITDPRSITNNPYEFATRSGEVDTLEKLFLPVLAAKDVPVNHILILDHREDPNVDCTLEAIAKVVHRKRPVHIKLIVIVGNKESIQAYP